MHDSAPLAWFFYPRKAGPGQREIPSRLCIVKGFAIWRVFMEKRIAVVSIIVEDTSVSADVNESLHKFGKYIVGRMGIPYRDRGVSIICIVMDAPGDIISSLSGKLGMLKGVSVKTVIAKHQNKTIKKEG
jgi:putative iron-only hydrogenase system regulator